MAIIVRLRHTERHTNVPNAECSRPMPNVQPKTETEQTQWNMFWIEGTFVLLFYWENNLIIYFNAVKSFS